MSSPDKEKHLNQLNQLIEFNKKFNSEKEVQQDNKNHLITKRYIKFGTQIIQRRTKNE